jgi:seryl-tRNA synthetase
MDNSNQISSDDTESKPLEEWLEHTAEARGVSKQELMDQMLSSYWILDELGDLVTETPSETTASSHSRHSSSSVESFSQSDTSTNRQRDPPPNAGSDKLAEPTATDERLQEIQTMIQHLIDAQQSLKPQPSRDENAVPSASQDRTETGVVRVASELQRQIGRVEAELDDVETQQETELDRLSSELRTLCDRVRCLETQYDDTADERAVEKLATDLDNQRREVTEQLEELQATDAALETQIEQDFDTIETLFERLFNSLEDLDSETGSLRADLDSIQRQHDGMLDAIEKLQADTRAQQSELNSLQQRQTNHKRLKDLKTEAWKLGIREATCESCARKVDLTLLETSVCPNCSAQFTEVSDGGWNPFRSPKLSTEPASLAEWEFGDS